MLDSSRQMVFSRSGLFDGSGVFRSAEGRYVEGRGLAAREGHANEREFVSKIKRLIA